MQRPPTPLHETPAEGLLCRTGMPRNLNRTASSHRYGTICLPSSGFFRSEASPLFFSPPLSKPLGHRLRVALSCPRKTAVLRCRTALCPALREYQSSRTAPYRAGKALSGSEGKTHPFFPSPFRALRQRAYGQPTEKSDNTPRRPGAER